MKKILVVLLVALGLQTQAQITCDSITTTYLNISPTSIEVTTNVMSFGIPFTLHSFDLYEGCQNAFFTHYDTNVVASIPLPSSNLVDTFVLCNWSDYGAAPYSCYSCDTFAYNWNFGNWNLLSIQQPLSITELELNITNNNKIYDLLGRELNEIPVGTMYIRNNKLYITK